MRASRKLICALFAATGMTITACDNDRTATPPESLPTETLATAVASTTDLSDFATMVNEAELGSVFDGRGVYTVLAPINSAFADTEGGQPKDGVESRPLLVASIRQQILPGYITLEAIRQSIDRHGGKIQMRTLGDTLVTFSREGEVIQVTGESGQSATLTGNPTPATNGAILPIDGLMALAPDDAVPTSPDPPA